MAALADFVGRLAPRQTLALLNMAGDRRDEDIAAFGALAARAFDDFVIAENRDTRGRPRGDLAATLRAALLDAGTDPARVTVELEEPAAIRTALDRTRHDQLTVLLVEKPAVAWAEVSALGRGAGSPPPLEAAPVGAAGGPGASA